MATDFSYGGKQILSGGPFKPNGKDMPSDARTRVESYADIASIPNPHVGLKITVKVDETNNNEMTDYIVKSLKANSAGIPNMAINEVVRYVDYLGVSAGGGSGEGLTSTQRQQLTTAYEHSQSQHVTSNDLLNIDAVSLNGKKFSEPMTKAQYDAIVDKDEDTIYLIDDDSSIQGVPNYTQTDVNKVLAVNDNGTALEWVTVSSQNNDGTLSVEQAEQLNTAYNHSQEAHVKFEDIPTKLSELQNDTNFIVDGDFVTSEEMNTTIENNIITKKTQSEYDLLSEDEKTGKVYLITDYQEPSFKLTYINNELSLWKGSTLLSSVTINSSSAGEDTNTYGNIIVSKESATITKGEDDAFTVKLDSAPTTNQTVVITSVSPEVGVSPSTLTFTSSNYSEEQTVTLSINPSTTLTNASISLTSTKVSSKTIVITIESPVIEKTLSSISAVYTQGNTVVYPSTSLNSLKPNLVVTATYSDNSTATITNYTLSGALSEGTSTVTITYNGKSTTFEVNVSSEPTRYTITNNLTNVTNNNSSSSIVEGSSYSATLSANSGYELSETTVTMGGVDITSTAYSNGSISISNVTGNIVITASATEIQSSVEPIISGGTLVHSYNLSAPAEDGTYTDTVGNWDLNSSKKATRNSNTNIARLESFSIVFNPQKYTHLYGEALISTGPADGMNLTIGDTPTVNGRFSINRDVSYGANSGALTMQYYDATSGSLVSSFSLNAEIAKDVEASIIITSDAETNTSKIYINNSLVHSIDSKLNIDGLTFGSNTITCEVDIYSGVITVG